LNHNLKNTDMKKTSNENAISRNPKGGSSGGNWPSTTGNPSGGGRGNR